MEETRESGWLTKSLMNSFKNRKLNKKKQEIEELKLEIEKAKLELELDKIKVGNK